MSTTQARAVTHIRYGFLEGNLESVPGHVYAEAVRAALEAAYPGAEVSVPWQANTSGALPATLAASVTTADGEEYDDLHDPLYLVADVQDVAGKTWEQVMESWQPPRVQMVNARPYENQGLIEYAGDGEDIEAWLDSIAEDGYRVENVGSVTGWENFSHLVKLLPEDAADPALYYLIDADTFRGLRLEA